MHIPTLSVKWSDLPMDESEVDKLLDAAVEEGAITYSKDRRSKDLKKDYFVHAALYRDGWVFEVLEETDKHRNIDLLKSNGEYWEVKSPDSKGNGRRPLRFVEGAFSEAKEQFRSHPDAPDDKVRVVLNTRNTPIADNEIEKEVRRLLNEPKNSVGASFVIVRKNGTVKRIK